MRSSRPSRVTRAIAGTAIVAAGALMVPTGGPIAAADPAPGAEPPAPPVQHNVLYRARADGTSRGAVVAYKQDDQNVNSAQPTMLPGQTFEVNTVLDDPKLAGMQISIDWPYGSNLHCEILVDDQIVAQADQFIAPRFFRVKDDPLYGTLQCGAPLDLQSGGAPAPPADPVAAPVPAPPPA